jgi:hypothetical protein
MPHGSFAFVITQIGGTGSYVRQRADDVSRFIIQPALEGFDLDLKRSDEDPTPGSITVQIVRSIITANVVIADFTGKNPNVYYELALAHAFNRPVVILVDAPTSLAFDMKDQRVIAIGDEGTIGAREAEDAVRQLTRQLEVVLAPNYEPDSLVNQAGRTQELHDLASSSGDPVAEEIAEIGEAVAEIRAELRALRRPTSPEVTGIDVPEGDKEDPDSWAVGHHVKHRKFGIGAIVEARGEGEQLELTIEFDKVGRRTLLAGYAPLEYLGHVPF